MSDSLSDTQFAPPPPRYLLDDRPFARGGMGEVFEACDGVLRRTVAVKAIRPEYASSPAVARAFENEARITSQLQHPGIPPVHDLYYDPPHPGGRPFLVMKLVKGRTFAAQLAERPDPAHDRPRFLHVFEQVCQAVGYAHDRNVVHRDLKPLNVMVGSFGEVQVMDWGLAKVLTDAPGEGEAAEADVQLTRIETGAEPDPTRAGTLKGTPAYMAPEQARGEPVDARADVFALGAILCVVLTGEPPYTGRSPAEADLAKRGALHGVELLKLAARMGLLDGAFERLDACGADPELVALAKRCLAPNVADRPADGRAVAEAVATYREAVEARAEHDRLARNAAAIDLLLGQCEAALAADDAEKAAVLLEQAEGRAADGGDAADIIARLDRCRRELAILKELDRIDDLCWTATGGRWTGQSELAAMRAEAFRLFGVEAGRTPAEDAARMIHASALRDRLLAGLDAWFAAAPSDELLALLGAADPDAYRDEVRRAVRAGDAGRLCELCDRADALDQPVRFAVALAEHGGIAVGRREQILQSAHRRRPGNFLVVMALANLHPPDHPGAGAHEVGWYRAALALRPAHPVVWVNFGVALGQLGDPNGAIAAYREALRHDPDSVLAHNNLGNALFHAGEVGQAVELYRRALALAPSSALAHYNLGLALHRLGEDDAAADSLGRAVELNPSDRRAPLTLGDLWLRRGDPGRAAVWYRWALALDPGFTRARLKLGDALAAVGDRTGAQGEYREAVRRDPVNAAAHNHLGVALQDAGDLRGAVAAFEAATALSPEHTRYAINLALARKREGGQGEPVDPPGAAN